MGREQQEGTGPYLCLFANAHCFPASAASIAVCLKMPALQEKPFLLFLYHTVFRSWSNYSIKLVMGVEMYSILLCRIGSSKKAWGTTAFFILFSLAMLLAGCSKKEPEKKAEVVRPVKIMKVKDSAEILTHGFPGTVRASRRAILSFEVSGPLVELPIEEGQFVKEGDLIAQIDKRDFLTALKQALARYREAEQQFRRYKELYAKKQVSKADFDRFLAARDVAKAKLEDAKNALCDTTLRAPFDGVIAKRYVENYYKVKAKEPIAYLQDISRIEIVVNVPELVMAALKARSAGNVNASFDAIAGKKFPLKVKEYSTEADPATQTYEVVFIMDQPEGADILPGMTATVFADFKSLKPKGFSIIVPALAVLDAPGNKPYVWVLDEKAGVVHKRFVKVGSLKDSCCIKITDGLKPGEIIVIAGVTKLSEGMHVRPWEKQREEI